MPRIREYNSGASLQVSGGNVEAAAATGQAKARGIAGFSGQIAEGASEFGAKLTRYEEENEASQLAADMATAQAELTKQRQDAARTADPNDKDWADNFNNNVVAPRLDQIGENLKTRAGRLMFQKARAGLAADFYKETTVDAAQLHGAAAVQNFITTRNQLSNAVQANPGSFERSMQLGDLVLSGLTDLPAEKRLELQGALRKDMAVAKIDGIAQNNPAAARAELNSGKLDEYIDAGDKQTLQGHIDTLERAAIAEGRAQQQEQRRQNKAVVDQASAQIVGSFVQPDGSLIVPPDAPKAIANLATLPDADPGEIRAMANMMHSVLNEPAEKVKSDPMTYQSFSQRLFRETGDPQALSMREVYQARADGLLSDRDFTFLHGAVTANATDPDKAKKNRDFTQIVNGLKPTVGGASNIFGSLLSAVGAQRFLEFSQNARDVYDAGIKANKSLKDITADIEATVPAFSINQKGALDGIQNTIQNPGQPLPQVRGNNITDRDSQAVPAKKSGYEPGMGMSDLQRLANEPDETDKVGEE